MALQVPLKFGSAFRSCSVRTAGEGTSEAARARQHAHAPADAPGPGGQPGHGTCALARPQGCRTLASCQAAHRRPAQATRGSRGLRMAAQWQPAGTLTAPCTRTGRPAHAAGKRAAARRRRRERPTRANCTRHSTRQCSSCVRAGAARTQDERMGPRAARSSSHDPPHTHH